MLTYRICFLFKLKKYLLPLKLGIKKTKIFLTPKLKKYVYFEGPPFKKKFGNFKQTYL